MSTKRNTCWNLVSRDGHSTLALDLSQSGVALHARDADTGWVEVREARLDDKDFMKILDEIRVETLVRAGRVKPITLWLPEEQVLVRQYLLNGSGEDAHAEARRRIAAETVYEPSDLMIALSTAKRGEPTTVLAALTQTVEEARHHAEAWGFTPGSVSTRVAAPLFGGQEPEFRPVERIGHKAARLSLRAVAAGVAVVVGGAAFYGAISSVEPLFDSVEPADPSNPVFAMVHLIDEAPTGSTSNPAMVRIGYPQGLALPKITVARAATSVLDSSMASNRAPASFTPAALEQPGSGSAMRVGPSLRQTRHARPGRLATDVARIKPASVKHLRAGVDRIRTEALSHIAAVKQAIAPLPDNTDQMREEPILLAALPSESDLPHTRRWTRAKDRPAPIVEPDSVIAPREMDVPPKPRPATALAEPEIKPASQQFANARPEAPVKPAPSGDTTPITVEVEETTTPEPPSLFAALNAPQPRTRPGNVPVFKKAPQQPRSITTSPGPRSVRKAAAEYGLALDQTSLIGIIDARAGRQALVRLPSGSFRRVTRGDDLEGWRVSSISREALRLTKQGQNRTLLLVSQ